MDEQRFAGLIARLPGAVKVEWERHEGVLVQSSPKVAPGEWGVQTYSTDELYLPCGVFPADQAQVAYTKGGKRITRRVSQVEQTALFDKLELGDVID